MTPLPLEDLGAKNLFYVLEGQRQKVLGYRSLVLKLFEHQVQTIVPIFTTIFCFFEERRKKRFLLRMIIDSIDGEVLDETKCLLVIQRIFQYLSVHEIQCINLDELCQKAYDFVYQGNFGFMSILSQSS